MRRIAAIFGIATLVLSGLALAAPASAAPTGHCHWWSEPNVIVGSLRGDHLVGTDCFDTIYGLQGRDVLVGASQEDTLRGGKAGDRLRGVDGFADALRGGRGRDRCVGDQLDSFFSCERVRVIPV